MRRPIIALLAAGATAAVPAQPAAEATPDRGHVSRTDIGRALHRVAGEIRLRSGEETVNYTATLAPGFLSGWHRHPGSLVVLVKSGTLTTYGLHGEPCVGLEIPAGEAYFEADASSAPYPHFVRNRGDVPTELVIMAFNVPPGGSPRSDADAPTECAEPTG
jgi:cupin domain